MPEFVVQLLTHQQNPPSENQKTWSQISVHNAVGTVSPISPIFISNSEVVITVSDSSALAKLNPAGKSIASGPGSYASVAVLAAMVENSSLCRKHRGEEIGRYGHRQTF